MLKKVFIALVCVIQLAVPAVIMSRAGARDEKVLREGTEYTFRLAELDYTVNSENAPTGVTCPYVSFVIYGAYDDLTAVEVGGDGFAYLVPAKGKGAIRLAKLEKACRIEVSDYFDTVFPEAADKEYPFFRYFEGEKNHIFKNLFNFDGAAPDGVSEFWIKDRFTQVLAVGKVYEGDIVITDLLIDGVSMKEYFRK
ncbi:MAG: hypothetical protein IJM45_04655 [Clostridia bacterium]|nr:hypothetical protein [Clostridia bacterium]